MNTLVSKDVSALVLRLSTGVLFLAHAYMKIVVFTPSGTAEWFVSIGLPGALAYLAILVELLAGIALILGYKTQIAALATVPVLLGAAYFGHGSNGWTFDSAGGGWEFPVFWAAVMLAMTGISAGKYVVISDAKTSA